MSTNSSSAQGISALSSARRPPRRRGRPSPSGSSGSTATGEHARGRRRRWRCSPPNTAKAVSRSRRAWRTRTAAATEMAFSLARTAADAIVAANKSARALAVETYRTLPRLARLGQINDHTRISLGRIMSEQARDVPERRVPAVRRARPHLRSGGPPDQQRGPRPDRGRRAAGRARRRADGDPAQRARRDRRAVAARRRGGADAARRRPGDRGAARRGVGDHRRPEQPRGGPPARPCGCWCSAAANRATCICPSTPTSIDMEKIDPDVVDLPGWYRPNPGLARDLAFVAFSYDRRRTRRPPDHQLPLGAVRVRHRIGRQPRPWRHRLLPHPAAPSVRAAGEPRRCRRRRVADRAVAGPAPGPVPAGDPSVRRDGGVLHLGDAA